MYALDHDLGFMAPVTLILHSRTYFSFPIYFHEFAEGLSLPIITQIQCDKHSTVNYASKFTTACFQAGICRTLAPSALHIRYFYAAFCNQNVVT